MPRGMHSPLPASLRSECIKASQILDSFVNGSFTGTPGKELPSRILANAKGLAILTVSKAGILASLRLGSGLLIARLEDGTWSAPSAIATIGVGAGGQAGFELTDFVFIINDAAAVRTFSRLGSLTLGGNISIAFGPVGRNAEFASGANVGGVASMYSYSKTKGLFGGVSLEGGVLMENRWVNRRFYGKEIKVEGILGGAVTGPEEEGREMMRILNSGAFQPGSGTGEGNVEGVAEAGDGNGNANGDGDGVTEEGQSPTTAPVAPPPPPTRVAPAPPTIAAPGDGGGEAPVGGPSSETHTRT